MRLTDALSSLSAIHAQLAKSEVYQGLGARPVVASGMMGLCAGIVQMRTFPELDAFSYVWFWLLTGAVCGLVGASGGVASYCMEEDASARRRTRVVAGQFLPCLAAGAFLPLALMPVLGQCVGLLPGLWALIYCLGLFSVRPYLPHATGWVGLYFFVAGILMLSLLSPAAVPSPWAIAVVFGLGQTGLAWVLHRNAIREKSHV